MKKIFLILAFFFVLLALIVAFLLTPDIYAAPGAIGISITVNTTTDEYGAGVNCSLREAITTANTDADFGGCTRVAVGSPPDKIMLQTSATYTLTRAGLDDTSINGDLDITETVTIVGNNSTINGNGATTGDRVLHIVAGVGVVNLSGVTIRNGRTTTSFGGGVRNDTGATLHLSNCTITNNTSTGNTSGGIDNALGGVMTIDSCTISNNSAATLAGGVSNDGVLTITNSTISGNTATNDRAGGIENRVAGTLIIISSTISGNNSSEQGGGINNENVLTLVNSTISGNDAPDSGGIYSKDTLTIINSAIISNTAISAAGMRITGTLTANIINSTISGNSATGGAGGIAVNTPATLNLSSVTIGNNESDSDNNLGGNGGGLNIQAGATVSLKNSIVASNVSNGGSGPNCFGTLASMNYTLMNITTDCTIPAGTGNLFGVGASAYFLANNGGPTLTHALQSTSVAIDAADPTGCTDQNNNILTTDQRGYVRHRDGPDTNLVVICDMGAFEYGSYLPVLRIFAPIIFRVAP